MIAIEQAYNQYRVKVSEPGTGMRGYSIVVADLAAAIRCVKHYYAKTHDRRRCDFCKKKVSRNQSLAGC